MTLLGLYHRLPYPGRCLAASLRGLYLHLYTPLFHVRKEYSPPEYRAKLHSQQPQSSCRLGYCFHGWPEQKAPYLFLSPPK